MTAELPLDSRQARIARHLLDESGTTSLERIATALQMTQRVVRYNLPSVEAYFAGHGVRLARRRGVGIWVEGQPGVVADLRADMDRSTGPAVLDPLDRQGGVLLALLEAAPNPLRSEQLETRLGVSRPTIRRDVRAAETWLEQHRLHLRRLPGVGLAVRGSELEVRAALLALVLERLPSGVLGGLLGGPMGSRPRPVAFGLEAYAADLDLVAFGAILAAELPGLDDRDPAMLTAAVGLAVLVRRVRAGRPARLVRGRLRSLLDHPGAEAAERIAARVGEEMAVPLAQPEVAAITELLLGVVELTETAPAPEAGLVRLVDRLVGAAARRLHPSLVEDDLLRANLSEHLRRLRVRLRYGLPVSNPLQQEVRKRYPDVYEIAAQILSDVGPIGGQPVPVEEVGFLTMYLAGSLERHRLRPKIRVTVVCPAGMATAWILVSRLLSEFPQLEVNRVVSQTAFEDEAGDDADLVVSTVPLEGFSGRVPAIVVGPLLSERDVRRLTRLLELPLQH